MPRHPLSFRSLCASFLLSAGLSGCGHHMHHGAAPPSITASGEGRATGAPDVAVVTVAAISEGKDAASAAADSARIQGDVIASVKGLMGDGGSVKTSGYNLNPVYDFNEGKQTLRAYQVRNAITIEVLDTKLVGPVIDAAVKAGAGEVSSVVFSIRENAALRDQAIAQASERALREAQAAARALGMRAGEVRTIAISSSTGGAPPMPMAKYGRMMEAAQAATPVEAGSVEVTASVTIEVRLEKP